MRKPPILILAFAAAFLFLLPGAASADDCWDVCNASTPCDTECGWDEGKGGPVTCGEQGLPCSEGVAFPENDQSFSIAGAGGFQVDYHTPDSCDHVAVAERSWHDSNEILSVPDPQGPQFLDDPSQPGSPLRAESRERGGEAR